MRLITIGLGAFFLVTLWGCQRFDKKAEAKAVIGPAGDNHWARGFEIDTTQERTRLLVFDPWNRLDTFAVYDFQPDYEPPRAWAVLSTTHIGFLDALGEADRVVGCSSPDRIFQPELRDRYEKGLLVRIGNDMDYNIESLHQLHPEVLIQSAFPGQKAKDARLLESDIEVIYLMEWLEPTPLGRAEWIRVFGLLLQKNELADSVFRAVEAHYLDLKSKAHIAGLEKPQVLIGNSFKGTWFVPGGNNYQTRLIEDAGMSYSFLSNPERGSLPLSFEAVLHEFREAPVWINVSVDHLAALKSEDERYALFKAFQDQRVYGYNQRKTAGWANDYWESGVVRPDLVLQDLLIIAYPQLFQESSLYYYKQLN